MDRKLYSPERSFFDKISEQELKITEKSFGVFLLINDFLVTFLLSPLDGAYSLDLPLSHVEDIRVS